MKKLNRKGFTIVELVIVIAVIAILAAVLIPTFSGVTNSAKKSAAQSTAKSSLEILLALNKGSMADGTVFAVDAKTDGATDYAFCYTGSKLRAFNDEEVDTMTINGLTKDGITTYNIYVSSACITEVPAVGGETPVAAYKKLDANTITLIKDLVPALIAPETGELSSQDGEQYYTLPTTDATTSAIKIYYTADLDKSCVVFVGNGNPVTSGLEAAD